jgi:hypothetical protein
MATKGVGHLSQIRTPCPARTVLGMRDTAYQAVERSLVKGLRIGIANPMSPST